MHAIHLIHCNQINFSSQWLIACSVPGAGEGAWNIVASAMDRVSALLNVKSIVSSQSSSFSTSVTFDFVAKTPSWNFLLSQLWRHCSCLMCHIPLARCPNLNVQPLLLHHPPSRVGDVISFWWSRCKMKSTLMVLQYIGITASSCWFLLQKCRRLTRAIVANLQSWGKVMAGTL